MHDQHRQRDLARIASSKPLVGADSAATVSDRLYLFLGQRIVVEQLLDPFRIAREVLYLWSVSAGRSRRDVAERP